MLTRITSEGLNVLQVKSVVEKVDHDFIVDRSPRGDFKHNLISPGVLLIDVEVYVDEENKEKLDDIEATGQLLTIEIDIETEAYRKHTCMIFNEIEWQQYINSDIKIYLGKMTLIVQETEGL